MGSSFWISPLCWPRLLPRVWATCVEFGPKMLPTIFSPSAVSTSSRFTPPSTRLLGWLPSAPASEAAPAGSWALACNPPSRAGMACRVAASAVTSSTPDRQYADQPDGRVSGSGPDLRRTRANTATRAASSSSVGDPLTTENTGSSVLIAASALCLHPFLAFAARISGARARKGRKARERASSQRDVPVLLRRQGLPLGAQQPQHAGDFHPGLVRGDHGVDVTPLGGDVGVG